MSTETKTETKPIKREQLANRATVAPPVDIFEDKEEILVLADLPGVAAEGLTVNLDKDELTIAARREGTGADEGFDYRRVFIVPRGIDAEKIGALLTNGVLRLTLPKPAALKPRQIAVRAS